jgi:hypothetical protein
MHPHARQQTIPELYPIGKTQVVPESGLTGSVLGQIAALWAALEALETNLPSGPDRWQQDSLFVAREGIRRAWLAIANLERSLSNRRSRTAPD